MIIGYAKPLKLSIPSRRINDAITRHGAEFCKAAYAQHLTGDGGRTIGFENRITTRAADAAIDAGRWLTTGELPPA